MWVTPDQQKTRTNVDGVAVSRDAERERKTSNASDIITNGLDIPQRETMIHFNMYMKIARYQ